MFSTATNAAALEANDDAYGVKNGEALVVDAPGVMDNDRLDGENAGESGATASLVSGVTGGVLNFSPDGSFSYAPSAHFSGIDRFTYRVSSGAVSSQATVTLTACNNSGRYIACWKEDAFLAKADELGFVDRYTESFEDDVVWAAARLPAEAPSVISQGIQWQSNHPDPPASNLITTGSGAARTGAARTGHYGVFDREHGYAENHNASQCNGDLPPEACLWHDGFTGVRLPGLSPLHGVGGYISGSYSGKMAIRLDGTEEIVVGPTPHAQFAFFGVIDVAPAGFMRFEFRELDGKSDQLVYVFGDDVTILGQEPLPSGRREINPLYMRVLNAILPAVNNPAPGK